MVDIGIGANLDCGTNRGNAGGFSTQHALTRNVLPVSATHTKGAGEMIKGILIALGIYFGLIPQPRPIHTDNVVWFDGPISPAMAEALEWDEFHAIAVQEYADEFTALFNSYETKRAKNGRIMIRQGDTGSFKFAKTK